MNKRELRLDKYGISSNRYKELCGFCAQYPEWKHKLAELTDTVKCVEITDMPIYHTNGDATGNLAVKRSEITEKIDIVEKAAVEAAPDLYTYILQSVCYDYPYSYLEFTGIPCSRQTFYDYRRKFFYILDKSKK